MVKYDKLYLITISLSSHLKIDICEDEDDNDEWTNGNLIYCNIQKKKNLKLCIVHQIQLNYFSFASSCSTFDMFQLFFPQPKWLIEWKFHLRLSHAISSHDNKRKMSIEWRKMCRTNSSAILNLFFFLLMSRRTQNKKKQVKLNIEDLISQSLSYVIAPSTRGDGRENEIPPIGYFAANILVVIELTMLCVWSTMCHVCVLSSGG